MKHLMIAAAMALSAGLMATPGVNAAPASRMADQAVNASETPVQKVGQFGRKKEHRKFRTETRRHKKYHKKSSRKQDDRRYRTKKHRTDKYRADRYRGDKYKIRKHRDGHGQKYRGHRAQKREHLAKRKALKRKHLREHHYGIGRHLRRGHGEYILEPRRYGLYRPDRGYQWVRIDRDVFLVAVATGLIVDAILY